MTTFRSSKFDSCSEVSYEAMSLVIDDFESPVMTPEEALYERQLGLMESEGFSYMEALAHVRADLGA